MAFEIPGFLYTLVSAADFTASQFRFVNAAAGKAALPTLGGSVVGVRQNKPNVNEATTIMLDGVSIVEAGAAIAIDVNVSCDATGRAITAAATQEIHGRALEAASAAGVKIAVLLRPAGRVA